MAISPIWGLIMESPCIPRYLGVTQRYLGSLEDMKQFIDILDKDPIAASTYAGLIEAATHYSSNPSATHTVFSTQYPIFEPGILILRKDIVLENQQWIYPLWHGGGLHMFADTCCVSRIVARLGDSFLLGTRCTFRGLRQSSPHLGNITIGNIMRGLPMMVHYNETDDLHQQLLYVVHACVPIDEVENLISTVVTDQEINFSQGCIDILGMG